MQRNLMWTLKQLSLSLEQYGREQLEALGISPTEGVTLHVLLSRKDPMVYAVNLHEALGLSKSAVSATLKALKQKGYLQAGPGSIKRNRRRKSRRRKPRRKPSGRKRKG